MKKGKTVWRIFLIVCLVIILVLGAFRIMKPKDEVVTKPLPSVSVQKIKEGDIEIETSLVASVEPGEVYDIYPKAAGEVLEIYAAAGQKVKMGDKLCLIDNQKAVDAAKIQLDNAELQVNTLTESAKLAKTNLDRMNALFASGDISAQTLEQTKNAYIQAESGLESIKLQRDSAQLQYDTQVEFSVVTSPVDGTVESADAVKNETVSQGVKLFTVSSKEDDKLTFGITDRLKRNVKQGDKIRLEKQGITSEGRITKIASMKNASGLYTVEASYKQTEDIQSVLSQGSYVKVYFVSESSKNVKYVDTDSVYYDGGKTYVYTVTYNEGAIEDETVTVSGQNRAATVHRIEVQTGLSDNGKTEIREGLSEDDLVICTWTSQLYEGALVQVLPEE